MAQRTPTAGFADTGIEKAAAKSASAGKKLCALCALCGYILRVLVPWWRVNIGKNARPKAHIPNDKIQKK